MIQADLFLLIYKTKEMLYNKQSVRYYYKEEIVSIDKNTIVFKSDKVQTAYYKKIAVIATASLLYEHKQCNERRTRITRVSRDGVSISDHSSSRDYMNSIYAEMGSFHEDML